MRAQPWRFDSTVCHGSRNKRVLKERKVIVCAMLSMLFVEVGDLVLEVVRNEKRWFGNGHSNGGTKNYGAQTI